LTRYSDNLLHLNMLRMVYHKSSGLEPIRIMEVEHTRFPSRTLILICGVIAAVLLAVLASVNISVPPNPPSARARAKLMAEMRVGLAVEASFAYYRRNHKLPLNRGGELWAAILEAHSPKEEIGGWFDANIQEVVDPWGTPLSIRESSGSVIITSAGPDRKFGTSDDIIETRSLQQ